MFDAARVEQHRGLGRTPNLRRLQHTPRRYARDFLRQGGGVFPDEIADLVEVMRVFGDEALVDPAAFYQHVQNAVCQRAVAARPHGQEQVGRARERSYARVNDDDFRAVVPGAPDMVGENRETFGDIGAGDEQRSGERDVTPGIGRAVNPKNFLGSGSRGNHAQPAVVVDIGSLDRHSRKLAHQVGFFIGQ